MGASRLQALGGLTPKERIFAQEYVRNGFNASKAGLVAYPNQKKKNIRSSVSDVMKRPHIQKTIVEIMNDKGLNDEFITNKLKLVINKGITEESKADTNHALKALEMAIRVRERLSKTEQSNLNIHYTQELNISDQSQMLTNRNKFSQFFDNIINGEETSPTQELKK